MYKGPVCHCSYRAWYILVRPPLGKNASRLRRIYFSSPFASFVWSITDLRANAQMLPRPTCLEFRLESVAGFSLYTARGSKRRHRGRNRGVSSLVKIARRVLIEAIYLSHGCVTSSRDTPILVWIFERWGSIVRHDLMGYIISRDIGVRYDTVCSHCCTSPSLTEINLRPDGNSQSYRFVWQLFERRGKNDGIIKVDCQISYIVPHIAIL